MSSLFYAILIILSYTAIANSYQIPKLRRSSVFLKPRIHSQARQESKLLAVIPSVAVRHDHVYLYIHKNIDTDSKNYPMIVCDCKLRCEFIRIVK